MPIYDFECESCSTRVELNFPISNVSKDYFCQCGAKLKRIWAVPNVIINSGIGFNIFGADGKRDTRQEEACKSKIKKIRDLWQQNPVLRKKARKKIGYQTMKREI